MKIVYLSNFFNHHQKPFADVLYQCTNHQFWFVETQSMPDSYKKTGYTEYKEPYVLRYSDDEKEGIDQLILDADAVIIGQAPVSMIKKRIEDGKLFFRVSERRYKSFLRYLKWPVYTYQSFSYNKGYLLAASAYASRDYVLSGMKPQRCFKWGYFTELKTYEDVDALIQNKHKAEQGRKVSMLWACRLIDWKHPELAVKLAKLLKADGYCFELKIAGIGTMESQLKQMIHEEGLEDVVKMIGPQKQEVLRILMEQSEIFLATSDQNEGWGATINESMNSACAVVASHAIGAVPFMIKDGENGSIFQSKNLESLYTKVKWLFDNPQKRKTLGKNAYLTIQDTWNAKVACINFLQLVDAITKGELTPILDGPCSEAEIYNHINYLSKYKK